MKKLIQREVKQLCHGCGLCQSIFPDQIKLNKEGNHILPEFKSHLSSFETKFFKKTCSGLNQSEVYNSAINHPVWGGFLQCKTGFSTDKYIRSHSSSGGVLTAIAIFLVQKKLVDAIIHISADEVKPLENRVKVSKTLDQIKSSMGSRYSPSAPLENILQILEADHTKKYCFIGKPCDVRALRLLFKAKSMYKRQVPYLLSFFCAGVPSNQGVHNTLARLHIEPQQVNKLTFRGRGWPGNFEVWTDSETLSLPYQEAWGELLGPTIHSRCKMCFDSTGEAADIISADVWEIDDKGYPKFEDLDGVGLVLTRTKKGDEIVTEMEHNKNLTTEYYNIEQLKLIQRSQYERKASMLVRVIVKFMFFQPIGRYNTKKLILAFSKLSLRRLPRLLLGTFKRAWKNTL